MGEIDLAKRFPDMNPRKRSPTLFQFNGIGFALHGERDRDPETSTYVATHWLTFLWIPLLALGAYRVSRAGDGWYVLGKVPTSTAARVVSWVVLLAVGAVIGGAAWSRYTDSPEYKAERSLERAEANVAAGAHGEAAALYRAVITGGTKHAAAARERFRALIEGPVLTASLEQATRVFQHAVALQKGALAEPISKDLVQRGLAVVRKHGGTDPARSLALLEVLGPLGDQPEVLAAERLPLLEALVKAQPGDLRRTIELAALYADQDKVDESVALLEPQRAQLADGEGARVLGQAYLRLERMDEALPLLEAYAQARVSKLGKAQTAYGKLIDSLWSRQIEVLNQGRAPESFYARHKRTPEDKQDAFVNEYVGGILEEDHRVQSARATLLDARRVIPVVLDVGIARLRRAQALGEEALRKRELVAAEEAFLSISEAAGESDAYRLYMAQVHYWLGRGEQGKRLFDEFLASHERSAEALMEVARTLRLLGSIAEARGLAEEAYDKPGVQPAMRAVVASLRAACSLDEDDELLWLRRSDKTQPYVASRWNRAEGRRAMRAGRRDEAEKHMRAAVGAFEGQPETETTLNDIADSYLALYELSGNREDFRQALKLIERAASRSPNDSILMSNSALLLLEGAVLDLLAERVDLEAMPLRANLGLLSYLYADEKGRAQVYARVRAHAGLKTATERFEQLLVIAPKSKSPYRMLGSIYTRMRQADPLRSLAARVRAATLDHTADLELTRTYWRDGATEGDRKRLGEAIERQRRQLDTVRGKASAATVGLAAGLLLEALASAHSAGMPVDVDEMVRVGEEAHRTHTSAATAGALQLALMLRADRDLRKAAPAYARLTAGLEHALPAESQLTLAMEEPGPLRNAALALDDVKRIGALLRAAQRAFPLSANPGEWMLVRALTPETLPTYTAALRAREDVAASLAFWLAFVPHDPNAILPAYWMRRAEGDEAGAQAILTQGKATGAPLPKR